MEPLPFWTWQFIGAMILNGIIQMFAVSAYAARAAGVQTKRIAISIALYSLFATASRLANMFYAPLLGTVSDRTGDRVAAALGALRHGSAALRHASSALAQITVAQFELQLRLIVVCGTVGVLVGALLLPMFEYGFVRGITSFERRESVLRALLRVADPRVAFDLLRSYRPPRPATWLRYRTARVPLKLLFWNTVLQAVYAIGVVAAILASVREPALARTATLLSGIVNGIGTISFTLFVDPTQASIVDSAVHGRRTIEDVRAMVFGLTVTMILGTLISQLLLFPAAVVIGAAAQLVHR